MATTTMNISLPDTLKSFVDERLNSDGYGTVSEYIRELIRADQKKREQEKLENLLVQRLQNGEIREFNLAEVKNSLTQKMAEKK